MKKIAVVEDNFDNRLLVHAILAESYQVTEYESGLAALAGMSAERPDLVLLDISLPGLDGVGVLKEVRLRPELRDLPVIALTAHAMAGDRERFLEEGFDDYVSKPILDDEALLHKIQQLLDRGQGEP